MEAGRKPLARTSQLIVEELEDELLVYDTATDRVHCLSPTAAIVWRRCDGRTPAGGISAQLGFDGETTERALTELTRCGLLESGTETGAGSTRRELTVRLAKAGGAVAAAPLIASIVAPTPAAALTPGCEGINTCLYNCGQTVMGCQGASCTCCELDKLDCKDAGVTQERTANVKRCVSGGVANCPPPENTTLCLDGDLCTDRAGHRAPSQEPTSATSADSPGATPSEPPSTPTSPDPAPPSTPTTPETAAPSTPTTPEPVAPAAPAPAPEPTPAPAPEPVPAPAPTTTTPTP